MNKTLVAIIVIVILIIGGWTIYQNQNPTPATGEPVKVGAVISLTGYAAAQGELTQKAIAMAVEDINNQGGINGRPIAVIVEDDHTEAKTAVTAYKKLVNTDKVQAVIGSLWDFTTQPLFPLADQDKITLISPSNFRIAGSFEPGTNSFVMLSDFNKVVSKLGDYLKQSEVKKLAVVRFNSGFGAEIAKTLNETMKALGQEEVIDEPYNEMGSNDFRTTVLKLKQAGVDTVFLDALDVDTLNFLKRSKELGFNPQVITHVLIVDALSNADVDKSLLEGVVVLNWEVTSADFAKKFESKYGVKPTKSADKAYAAVEVLAQALSKVDDKTQLATYLEGNEFKTAIGTIKFTPDHAVQDIEVQIQSIKNGKLESI
jgi:branched-chain amino acid transport system substrate-binding protein